MQDNAAMSLNMDTVSVIPNMNLQVRDLLVREKRIIEYAR